MSFGISALKQFMRSCLCLSGVAKLEINGASGEPAGDPAKRIRNLKKKLTQIQQLREKVAGGASLEPEQQSKLNSEAEVLEELKALGEEL